MDSISVIDNLKVKFTVLVVDDNSKNLQVVGNLLKGAYNIDVATNGRQALTKIEKRPPDLILLDVMMPILDGYKVCEILKSKEATAKIPIIFLTAKVETEDIIRGFKLGAVDYVLKPFNSAELLARVHTQLELNGAKKKLESLEKEVRRLKKIIVHYQNVKTSTEPIGNEGE